MFPIHTKNHWSLIVVNIKGKALIAHDSWDVNLRPLMTKILDFLKKYHEDVNKSNLIEREWSSQVDYDNPKQDNEYDYGAFVCLAANLASINADFHFSQDDMVAFKQQMSEEILSKSLKNPIYAFRE